jgi:hypothetical protein
LYFAGQNGGKQKAASAFQKAGTAFQAKYFSHM